MYKPLCAGDLSHRLQIQVFTESQSGTGAILRSETIAFATVWGRFESLSGKELIAAQQLQSKIEARATIRYRQDILDLAQANTPLQVLCKNVPYVVEAVLPDERFADSLMLMLSGGPTA